MRNFQPSRILGFVFSVATKQLALDLMIKRAQAAKIRPVVEKYQKMVLEHYQFGAEDSEMNRQIGIVGQPILNVEHMYHLANGHAEVLTNAFDTMRDLFFPEHKGRAWGFCPLLAANHAALEAEKLLIKSLQQEAATDRHHGLVNLVMFSDIDRVYAPEVFHALVDLILSYVTSYCSDVVHEFKKWEAGN